MASGWINLPAFGDIRVSNLNVTGTPATVAAPATGGVSIIYATQLMQSASVVAVAGTLVPNDGKTYRIYYGGESIAADVSTRIRQFQDVTVPDDGGATNSDFQITFVPGTTAVKIFFSAYDLDEGTDVGGYAELSPLTASPYLLTGAVGIIDTGLPVVYTADGTERDYTVQAFETIGSAPYDTVVYSAPLALPITLPNTSAPIWKFNLSWDAVNGSDGYRVNLAAANIDNEGVATTFSDINDGQVEGNTNWNNVSAGDPSIQIIYTNSSSYFSRLLVVDDATQRVGINNSNPAFTLDVDGSIAGNSFQTRDATIGASGLIAIGATASSSNGGIAFGTSQADGGIAMGTGSQTFGGGIAIGIAGCRVSPTNVAIGRLLDVEGTNDYSFGYNNSIDVTSANCIAIGSNITIQGGSGTIVFDTGGGFNPISEANLIAFPGTGARLVIGSPVSLNSKFGVKNSTSGSLKTAVFRNFSGQSVNSLEIQDSNGVQIAAFDSIGRLNIKSSTPANAAATGVAGTVTWDSSFIYVCVATNTWKRVAISTW